MLADVNIGINFYDTIIMRKINPKCSDHISFMSSIIIIIIISLHYYELLPHPERYSKFKKHLGKYENADNSYEGFEYCNPTITLTVFNENKEIIYTPKNNTDNKAYIVKINNQRYNAIKPKKPKSLKLKELLSSFTHEELTDYLLRKVMH